MGDSTGPGGVSPSVDPEPSTFWPDSGCVRITDQVGRTLVEILGLAPGSWPISRTHAAHLGLERIGAVWPGTRVEGLKIEEPTALVVDRVNKHLYLVPMVDRRRGW